MSKPQNQKRIDFLRTTAASPLLYVQPQLGHSDASVTLRYYSTWMPGADEERHVERLDRIWNQIGTKPRKMARPGRFEHPTYRFVVCRSIQLS